MQNTEVQFKEVSYRWVIFAVFSALTFFSGMNTVNIPPIATTIQKIYNVDSYLVNLIPVIYLLVFALLNLPANYFIDQKGIRVGLNIGCIFFLFGNAIQMLINFNFTFMIVGTVFVAVSQPFVLNSSAKIATFWFLKQHRTNVVTALSLFNLVGTGVGFLIPTLLVDNNASIQDGKQQTFYLIIIEFIIVIISCICVFIFMRDKPEVPASLGAETQKTPFRQSLRKMWQNKNFMKLVIAYMFFLGPINTLGGLLNYLFTPFNFQNIQISIFGIILLVAGILGSAVTCYYISITLRYAFTNKIITTITLILVAILLILLKYSVIFGLFIFILFLLGFFVTPMYPLGIDYGCQICFPVGEAQISGSLNTVSYFGSSVLIIIMQFSVGFGTRDQSFINFVILLGLMILGAVFYWLVEDDLKRRKMEEQNLKQNEGEKRVTNDKLVNAQEQIRDVNNVNQQQINKASLIGKVLDNNSL